MRVFITSSVACLISSAAAADVFGPGPGGRIPDSLGSNSIPLSGLFTSTLNISATGTISSFNSVTLINFTNTWVGDLQAYLTSPTGTRVNLFSRVGVTTTTGFGNSNDVNGDYTFTEGGLPFGGLNGNGPTPPGTYARSTNADPDVIQVGPIGALQGINTNTYSHFVGESVTGTWTLTIRDFGSGDVGALGEWHFDATIPAPTGIACLALAALLLGRPRER